MIQCTSCSEFVKPAFRFCPGCGTSLRDASSTTRPAVIPSATERKIISVLFADLCGSTQRVAGLDAEEAKDYLEQVLDLMTKAVHAYGGTVSQLLGDGLIALFGAPIAHEDHAMRACLSAIAMQQRARAERLAGKTMALRIGIHSGEVVVGPSHDDIASFYRADGSTIHIASRIEQLAKPDTVLISAASFRLVNDQLDAQTIGMQPIRGLDKNIELFELATIAQRSPAGTLAQRGELSPLVGREAILADMDALLGGMGDTRLPPDLASVAGVHPASLRVVGLRADAGIGKSRLLHAVRTRAQRLGIDSCHVIARTWTGQQSLGVLTGLIAELIAVPWHADPKKRIEATRETLRNWPPDTPMHRAVVNDLLRIDPPDPAWLQLTPVQRRREITATVQWLITTRATGQCLLIVIDDLHLADRDSIKILESVTERVQSLPLFICLGYRPELTHSWRTSPWFKEVDLSPLPADTMHQLAIELLGTDPSLEGLVARLVLRAEGNPLFVEQFVMTLVDNGSLLGTPGSYRCVSQPNDIPVPESIAAIIAARVDRLPAGAKALIEAAAVMAEPITADAAAKMLGGSTEDPGGLLNLTSAAGLTRPSLDNGRQVWQFAHGLVQEVIVGSLTSGRRKGLHRAACDVLLSGASEHAGDRAAVVANHAWHGEAWQLAAEQSLQALATSISRSANRDALRMFDLGIDAIGHLKSSKAKRQTELTLRLTVLGAQLPMGRVDDIVSNLEHAASIAQALGDARQQANVSLQLAVTHWVRGSYAEGLAAAGLAKRLASDVASRRIVMAATQLTMMLEHGLGNYPAVIRHARRISTDHRDEVRAGQSIPGWAINASINVLCFLGDALWRTGELEAAQQACDSAYRELADRDHAFSRSLVDFTQAEVLRAGGKPAAAAALLQTTAQACRQHDLLAMLPPVIAALAGATALSGKPQQALTQLESALASRIDQAGGRYNAVYFPKNRAIALACLGRLDEAAQAAGQACAAAARYHQAGNEAESLWLLADIETAAARHDDARAHRERAAVLAARFSLHAYRLNFNGTALSSASGDTIDTCNTA